MTQVKWIKMTTSMFDDEKIKLIEQMPEADTILIIWIKLLVQAGKTNASGFIFLSENIPYTDEMLATIFNRPLNTVRLALQTLNMYGMISIDDENFIEVVNWEKHQNIEGLERLREQTRVRVAKHREKKKLGNSSENDDENVTLHVTLRNATDIDKEIDKDNSLLLDVIEYLNLKTSKKFKHTTGKTKTLINARVKEGFVLEDFKKVIDVKVSQWLNNDDMSKYLRPETLFGTKFEAYLNEHSTQHQDNQTANKQSTYQPFNYDMSRGE